MTGSRPGSCRGALSAFGAAAARQAIRASALVVLTAILPLASVHAEEPPPFLGPSSETVPVERPSGTTGGVSESGLRTVPLRALWDAEERYRSGNAAKALPLFLGLARDYADDERKGFVWMRIAELLLSRQDLPKALEAADKAIFHTRARFLVFVSMDLKYRICRQLGLWSEARQMAAFLLDQGYINAEPSDLLAELARLDGQAGKISLALSEYGKAIAAAADPGSAALLRAEREAMIDGVTSIPVLRDAVAFEPDSEVRERLYLQLGRTAVREGFPGMGAFALEKASRGSGSVGEEAALQLFRLEQILASRPKIVGLLPLSGPYADMGFAVLAGAEVALRQSRVPDMEFRSPVLLWVDTGGRPEKARSGFLAIAPDPSVIGFIGPLTGEEGHSVSVVFDPHFPPVLYLGQKRIPEKPFLYSFGLTPQQEAEAVLSYLARLGKDDLILFFPDNGYGRGFSDAVISRAGAAGVRITRSIPYSPETIDFTDAIRQAVGKSAFDRSARKREKGTVLKLPQKAILIADRWERVFLLATQLRFYNVYLPLAGFSGWNDERLLEKAGDAVDRSVFAVDYAGAVPGYAGEKFRQDYRNAFDRAPARFEAMGYDAALLLAESFPLETHTDPWSEWEPIREKAPRLRFFRGVTGTFQFEGNGNMRRTVSLLGIDLGNYVPIPER